MKKFELAPIADCKPCVATMLFPKYSFLLSCAGGESIRQEIFIIFSFAVSGFSKGGGAFRCKTCLVLITGVSEEFDGDISPDWRLDE
jgi:hypothetical protein